MWLRKVCKSFLQLSYLKNVSQIYLFTKKIYNNQQKSSGKKKVFFHHLNWWVLNQREVQGKILKLPPPPPSFSFDGPVYRFTNHMYSENDFKNLSNVETIALIRELLKSSTFNIRRSNR